MKFTLNIRRRFLLQGEEVDLRGQRCWQRGIFRFSLAQCHSLWMEIFVSFHTVCCSTVLLCCTSSGQEACAPCLCWWWMQFSALCRAYLSMQLLRCFLSVSSVVCVSLALRVEVVGFAGLDRLGSDLPNLDASKRSVSPWIGGAVTVVVVRLRVPDATAPLYIAQTKQAYSEPLIQG